MELAAIRTELRKQPFRPFALRLADGRSIHVPHPDFVAISPRHVIVIHPDESYSVLEPLLIISLEVGNQAAGSQPGAN